MRRGHYNNWMALIRPARAPSEGAVSTYLGNQHLTCQSGNISITGMLLYPPQRADPGQFMRLVFALGDGKWLDLDAVLVRIADEQPRYAWGIKFLETSDAVLERIQGYVREKFAAEPLDTSEHPAVGFSTGTHPSVQERSYSPQPTEELPGVYLHVRGRKSEKAGEPTLEELLRDWDTATPIEELYDRALKELRQPRKK